MTVAKIATVILFVDTRCNLSEIPTSSFNCFIEKTEFPIFFSCYKFCNNCRLFPFWKQSVVRNNRTTNGGIFQNGNNHSKQ